tara:strand:+ start:133 stop:612 length:480 start_codon:yes stop_codon:yes gene_type:complete
VKQNNIEDPHKTEESFNQSKSKVKSEPGISTMKSVTNSVAAHAYGQNENEAREGVLSKSHNKSRARLSNALNAKSLVRDKTEQAIMKTGSRKASTSKSYGSIQTHKNLTGVRNKSMSKPITRDKSNTRKKDEQRSFMRNTLERYQNQTIDSQKEDEHTK